MGITSKTLFLATSLWLAACVRDNTQTDVKLARFSVTIDTNAFNIGTPESRLPFAVNPVIVPIHIEAIGTNGLPFPLTQRLLVTAEPGQVVGGGDLVTMTNGVADAQIPIRLAFGDTALWVHEVDPVNGGNGNLTCAGGCQNGSVCYRGRLCSGPSASIAMGIAGPIFFEDPRISDIQATTDPNSSTLANESLTVSGGTQIVTGIFGQGFYVTDIDDPDGQFNSIFVFTFNQPEEIGLGDRLAKISGIVAEFVGSTQLTQPGFDVLEESRTDLIPAPKVITPQEAADATGQALEPFESSLVSIKNVTTASVYIRCDDVAQGGNGNDSIDTEPERSCADACFAAAQCSEKTNFDRFGQYTVLMSDGQTKIQIVSRDTIREFDPTFTEDTNGNGTLDAGEDLDQDGQLDSNLGIVIPEVIGTLRDIQFADPRAVVQPRFPSDLVLQPAQ